MGEGEMRGDGGRQGDGLQRGGGREMDRSRSTFTCSLAVRGEREDGVRAGMERGRGGG